MEPAEELRAVIETLIARRQSLTFAYAAGSKPGAVRTIHPVRVDNATVAGRDLNDGADKRYKLNQIIAVYGPDDALVFSQAVAALPWPSHAPPQTMADITNYLADAITQRGWVLHRSEWMLGAGDYFKNGKPKKTPLLSIAEQPTEHRRWYIASPRFTRSRTTDETEKAAKIFFDELVALTDSAPP